MSETCCNKPLSEMTVDELECLLSKVRGLLDEREEEASANRRQKLKASGRLKEFKEELKAVKKGAKELAAKKTYDVVVPITFTVKGDLYEDIFSELTDYGDLYWSDMMSFVVKGKVAGDFSKEQQKLLQGVLDTVLEDACEDFMLLFPDLIAERDALEKRASKLVADMDAVEVTVGDL